METELKLKIDSQHLATLHEHPLIRKFARDAPTETNLIDTYYDTPQLALWHQGLTLRVREEGNIKEGASWLQTLKTASASSTVLHERGEWESPLSSSRPHPVDLARKVTSHGIAKLLRSRRIGSLLHPVFTSQTRRTAWHLQLPDDQVVECSLDTGEIHCADKMVSVGELEFELKRGNPGPLFGLALALHQQIPMQVASDSKAARGYALMEDAQPAAVGAKAIRLKSSMTLESALHCMGINCLEQIEANLQGVLKQDAESLHQMRVGLRRLRALVNMFDHLAPLPAETRNGIEWLAQALGASRDWDVLANSTLEAVDGGHAEPLKAAATAKVLALHQELLQALADPRYTELVLQLNAWFYSRQWRSGAEFSKKSPLMRRASSEMTTLLAKAQDRLRKRAKLAKGGDPAALHSTRIAAKKARYAVEFFADLLPRRAARRYISGMSQLQDVLGALNDLEVAKRLVTGLNETPPSSSASYVLGYLSCKMEPQRASARRAVQSRGRAKMPI